VGNCNVRTGSLIIRKDYCLKAFVSCKNVTFTDNSYHESTQFEYNLEPGTGCYNMIDRWDNGSYGTMSFEYPNKTKLYVFDDYVENVSPGDLLGLPVTDDGWTHRKVFIANADEETVSVTITYNLGVSL